MLRPAYAAHPDDTPVPSQLAQLYDRMGQEPAACAIYGEIMKRALPPQAAVNDWGTCLASEGRLTEAMPLWESVTERNPAEESAWMNLAVAQIQTGDPVRGRDTLRHALRFHPASARARQLLAELAP